MDAWELEGREFRVVMASDVIRDGMGGLNSPISVRARATGPRGLLARRWQQFDFIIHETGTLQFSVIEGFFDPGEKGSPTNQRDLTVVQLRLLVGGIAARASQRAKEARIRPQATCST